MRRRYPIEVVDERIVLLLDGARALLDTSCTTSLGGGRPLQLLGQTYPVAERPDAFEPGEGFDLVLGCDILAHHFVLVDRPAGFVMLSRVPLVLGEDSEPLDLSHGVPIVQVEVAGVEAPALVATGVRQSYMDPDLAAAHPPTGTARESHPTLGTFTSEVRRLEARLGEYAVEDEFGVLPEDRRSRILPGAVRWVLGAGLLRDGPLLFDLAAGRISFPGTSPLDGRTRREYKSG